MADEQAQITPTRAAEPAESLPTRARTVWMINELIWLAVVVLIVVAIIYVLRRFTSVSVTLLITIGAALTLAQAIWAAVSPGVRQRQWRYAIAADEVDLMHGVVVRTRQIVPMARIQHVDTNQGPLQRRYGLSTVKMFTAAGTLEIPQLDAERANDVRDQIADLAKVNDDVV